MNASTRTLKAFVIGMAIVILAGVTIVGVTIVKRGGELAARSAPEPTAESSEGAAPRGFDHARLELPEGSRVVEMVTEDERLVLRLRLADASERLLFIDMGSGEVIGTLDLRHAP
ncbi:MAG: hypothetical protein V3T29_01600 [Alphaproteobacteria bacterium]